eukprot:TRINITY_DN7826_c0_g1_i1.p1 TRINITY_DN7826_c0_g1~~TRINITY_DN7826_c0_g1_i1.p1  ORF type:complete len:300 (+),score=33.64 TRINITY_DN7826_c0_g1_i1:146-1045(+)
MPPCLDALRTRGAAGRASGRRQWRRGSSGRAPIDPVAAGAYRRDGAVVLRGVLSPADLSLLTEGIRRNMAEPGPFAGVASNEEDPGRFFEDFCNWQRVPEYEAFIRTSALAEMAGRLMGCRTTRLYHDHLLVKEPLTAQATPWHQDQPYYNISGRDSISFWIPIDPVPLRSTLEFVAGSHAGPWYMPRTFLTEHAMWFPEGSLEEVPQVSADRARYPVVAWALAPGDVVAFHMLTLHASAGTTARRRAFSLRFIGDDVRHAPRPWRTSPPFPGLCDELPAGAEMDHPLFPVVYTNPDAT